MNFDVRFYGRLLVRRLPVMAALFLICSGIGAGLAIKLPTTYSSAAKLLVESAQLPGELASTTVSIEAAEQLEIIRQRLMTRANMLDIANEMKVFENRSEMTANDVVDEMRKRTSIRSGGRPLVVTISFQARRPKIAAGVVNKYVTQILDANTKFRTSSARETLQFFEQDVERLDNELAIQSQKILAFKTANADALPSSEQFNRNRRANLQQEVTRLQRERDVLKDQRARLVDIFERTGRVQAEQQNLSPRERQLESLRAQLENALIVFSPSNPNIRVLQARIQRLEGEVAAEKGTSTSSEETTQQQLFEISVAQIDGRLEQIETELKEAEEELEHLDKVLQLAPQNAIVLDSLERDFSSIKNQYNTAVSRLSQARMGERIEESQRGQRISLIEPATEPNQPSSPNRPIIAAAGVGAGIGLALAFFVMLELLHRTIRRPIELENALGIKPIAVIPYMESERHRLIRRGFRILLILVVIIGLPTLVWVVDTYYMPVDLLIEKLIKKLGL